jgi:hypothetical protein
MPAPACRNPSVCDTRSEKGLYLPEALMTAAGLLLGSCAGLLAARRLCAISTRKRAGEGGPEAAQASWEREGSLSRLA